MESEESISRRTGTRGSTWNILRKSFSRRRYARQFTARRSSPWWKLRWSRNSCPAPGKRDRLCPPTSPAKDFCQWMVSRSSFSRNSRSNSGADGIVVLRRRCLCGYTLDDGTEDGFRVLAVGVGVEVENDAVPQHRWSYVEDILHRQVEPAAHQGAYAAALDQALRAARRAAVADVL